MKWADCGIELLRVPHPLISNRFTRTNFSAQLKRVHSPNPALLLDFRSAPLFDSRPPAYINGISRKETRP